MNTFIFSKPDQEQIKARGQTTELVFSQLNKFEQGHRLITLNRPATLQDGIFSVTKEQSRDLTKMFELAAQQGRVSSFIPASGAATRMFKGLLSILHRTEKPSLALLIQSAEGGDTDAQEFLTWWKGIELGLFPFHTELIKKLAERGLNLTSLITTQTYLPVLECLLTKQGFNFSELPKAFIPFHLYTEEARLSLEEHLLENLQLICDEKGECKLHFTVSEEHESQFQQHLDSIQEKLVHSPHIRNEKPNQTIHFEINISHQKNETDTITVDEKNQPVRNTLGELVFRPGGHGALIKNLAATEADIIFIKNIDNVVTDENRYQVIDFRKTMGGLLVQKQNQIFEFLQKLEHDYDQAFLKEIEIFLTKYFGITFTTQEYTPEKIRTYLDRPLRVCAMVKNQGEPGGGPFWVQQLDGMARLQIVESSEVNQTNADQKLIFSSATHFNPVDLVCGLKNFRGENFDLEKFVDHNAYFISTKSLRGRTVKALELPGLWNGSMALWNTLFIEAPEGIFNPVKTVNDLLRQSHQVTKKK